MFSDAINLVGASGAGAILGLIGNFISAGIEKKRLEVEASKEQARILAQATGHYREPYIDEGQEVEISYLWGLYHFSGKTKPKVLPPVFHNILLVFAVAYSASATYCIMVGDVPVATINPTTEPVTQSILFGLWERSYTPTTVAVQTFASVGQYMFHFIAFILSAVITGAVPKRG